MTIYKRDGRKADFSKDKIKIAVLKAFADVDGEETAYAKEKAREIANYIESLDKDLNVESIQNIVEEKLMSSIKNAKIQLEQRKEKDFVEKSNK